MLKELELEWRGFLGRQCKLGEEQLANNGLCVIQNDCSQRVS